MNLKAFFPKFEICLALHLGSYLVAWFFHKYNIGQKWIKQTLSSTKHIFHSLNTILSPKFARAAQTVTILSQFARVAETASSLMLFSNLKGRILWKIVYIFFKRPITFSMWILTDAIFHDTSTSFADSCDLPLVNAGINNSAGSPATKLPYWHQNTGLVSSRASLTSCGEGASLALVGHPFSDDVTIKIFYINQLHTPSFPKLKSAPTSYPITSYPHIHLSPIILLPLFKGGDVMIHFQRLSALN